jgi:hypothetical protein
MMLSRPSRPVQIIPVLLLALRFFSSTAVAQSKPDFSGTWKPLPASAQITSAQITIAQEGPSFVVTTAFADGSSETLTHRLDGRESRNTVKDATGTVWTHVSKATWMNSAVVITTTTIPPPENGGKWEWMRVYSLESDGELSVRTFDGVLRDVRFMATITVSYGKVSQR